MISQEAIYCQAEQCLLEEMDGELLLYNPATTTTLHLNDSSAMVWDLCDGRLTVAEITETLQSAFPDQAEQISEDVRTVLRDLSEQSALVLKQSEQSAE